MAKKKPRRNAVTLYGQWVYMRLMQEIMTLQDLSDKIGVKNQNLCNYLHGQLQAPGYRTKIERILGEPPTEIKQSPEMAG